MKERKTNKPQAATSTIQELGESLLALGITVVSLLAIGKGASILWPVARAYFLGR